MHSSNINDTFGKQTNLMESMDKIVMIDSKIINLLQSAQSDNILEDEISKQQEELFLINQRIQKLHDKKQKRLEKKQRIENIFINLQQKQTAASILKRYDIKDPTQFLDSSQDYTQRNLTFRPQISQASIEILKTSRNVTPNGKSRTKSKQKNLVEKLHKEYVKRRQSIELQCIHKKMQEEELEMKECTFTPKLSRNSRDLTGSRSTRKTINAEDFYQQQKLWNQQKQQKLHEIQANNEQKFTFHPQVSHSKDRLLTHQQFDNKLMKSKGITAFLQRQHDAIKNRLELKSMLENMGLSKSSSQIIDNKQLTHTNPQVKQKLANQNLSKSKNIRHAKSDLKNTLQSIDTNISPIKSQLQI
eukprot:403352894